MWKAAVVYLQSLSNEATVQQTITEPLVVWARPDFVRDLTRNNLLEQITSRLLVAQSVRTIDTLDVVLDELLEGHSVLFIDRAIAALVVETKGWPSRGVEKPATEVTVQGPQVAFNETMRDNVALIRLRLKSPDLVVERMQVGRKSRTDVRVIYLHGVASKEIVDEVKRRIMSIDTDMILDTGMIRNLIRDEPFSPFMIERLTERPDTVAAELNEGRVAILANNTPYALILPASFLMTFETAEDRYINENAASVFRLVRHAAYWVSILGTPLYVAVVTFHHELIPLPLLLNIASTQEGVPFPLGLTAFATEIMMEILREAGVRLPQQFGAAVSIVGALVLGQAAIQAGFVPPSLVIVVTLTTIASFTVPRSETIIATRILRYPLLAAGSTLGFFGVALGLLFMIYHLSSLKSLGQPYLALYPPGKVGRLKVETILVPPQLSPVTRSFGRYDKVRRGIAPAPKDPKRAGPGGKQ
jgi:spore germination protein KA